MPDNILSDERLVELLAPDENRNISLYKSERVQIIAHARALAAERDRWKEDYELCQRGLNARRELHDETLQQLSDLREALNQ